MVVWFRIISQVVGIIGTGVIVWGTIISLIDFIKVEWKQMKGLHACKQRQMVRHAMGSYLLIGLEFLIAADIITTIQHPQLKEISILASIVFIRTVISYFLNREMKDIETTEL